MSNIFSAQDIDETLVLIGHLIRESCENLCRGNINKVCLNDKIIAKHIKNILRIYRYLNVNVGVPTLILSLCHLKRVKDVLNAYNVFIDENVSRLKSEYVMRSAAEGCMDTCVSVQYSIHGILHRIVDGRIRTPSC